MRHIEHGILHSELNAARAAFLFELFLSIGGLSVRRSDKFGKVRELDPNSLGARFGDLVRKYMVKRGLGNQDVARLVYLDEEAEVLGFRCTEWSGEEPNTRYPWPAIVRR